MNTRLVLLVVSGLVVASAWGLLYWKPLATGVGGGPSSTSKEREPSATEQARLWEGRASTVGAAVTNLQATLQDLKSGERASAEVALVERKLAELETARAEHLEQAARFRAQARR